MLDKLQRLRIVLDQLHNRAKLLKVLHLFLNLLGLPLGLLGLLLPVGRVLGRLVRVVDVVGDLCRVDAQLLLQVWKGLFLWLGLLLIRLLPLALLTLTLLRLSLLGLSLLGLLTLALLPLLFAAEDVGQVLLLALIRLFRVLKRLRRVVLGLLPTPLLPTPLLAALRLAVLRLAVLRLLPLLIRRGRGLLLGLPLPLLPLSVLRLTVLRLLRLGPLRRSVARLGRLFNRGRLSPLSVKIAKRILLWHVVPGCY